jgi:hypothetical protein
MMRANHPDVPMLHLRADGAELCTILGFDSEQVTGDMEIHIPVDGVPTATVNHVLTVKQLGQILALACRFPSDDPE